MRHNRNKLQFCLIVTWLWSTSSAIICPPHCSCYLDIKGRNTIFCGQGGLVGPISVADMDLHTEVIKITAPENNMNMLTIGPNFQDFKQLEELHIMRSNVPELGMYLFWGLTKLDVLNFSQNNITQPLDENFRGLHNLKELNLDDNRISSLPSGTFRYLTSLRVLSIQRNRIHEMVPRIFIELGKLQVLKLSGNNLGELNPVSFQDTKELRELECRGCGLKKIDNKVYTFLRHLTHLDLGYNEFTHISQDDFAGLEGLRSLQLDGNKLAELSDNTFVHTFRMKKINVSKNRISFVNNKAFSNLSNISEVDISYNKLDYVDPIILTPIKKTIRKLDLSGNHLPTSTLIDFLKTVPALFDLQLADAGLTELPVGLVPANIYNLNLAGNHLVYITPQSLPATVKRLDISNNRFRGLQEDVMQRLEFIAYLKLDNNPWSCDLCHITPMLERANKSVIIQEVICTAPYIYHSRNLGSLRREELTWCTSQSYSSEGANFFLVGTDGRIGMIAASVSILLLSLTCFAVAGTWCYTKRHAAKYYTNEEKRGGECEAIFENQSSLFGDEKELSFKFPADLQEKKISIATIDEEFKKDSDILHRT